MRPNMFHKHGVVGSRSWAQLYLSVTCVMGEFCVGDFAVAVPLMPAYLPVPLRILPRKLVAVPWKRASMVPP